MRFELDGKKVDRPCFWLEDNRPVLIDQRRLPGEVVLLRPGTLEEMKEAIRTLAIRGAPALGAFSAAALSFCIQGGIDPDRAYTELLLTRPTAVDLRNCLNEVTIGHETGGSEGARAAASRIYERIIHSCMRIGEEGAYLIKEGARVLTHCNAGALASLDWGTALAPVRFAKRQGLDPFVWVSETRPLLQGSRLTSWELREEGIRHSIVVDSSAAHLISRGMVDMVLVGADRVCMNGDIANKVGTYGKALAAREHDVPFYVAFPWTTFDPRCPSGDLIPIEERGAEEVLTCMGAASALDGVEAYNPAFDVTPSRLIKGYITEFGVLTPLELRDRSRDIKPVG